MSNNPKKILIDARMAGTSNAGIGRSIEELIKNLIKSDTENVYYFLLLFEENFSLFDEWFEGLGINRFHKILVNAQWYTFKEQFVVLREIRKINPDLVYFPHFNVPIFYFGKFIVTIHDLIWIKYPRPRKEVSTLGPILYFIKNFFSKIVFRFAVKRARKVMVPTEFTKHDIVKFYKISSEKIKVVNWGVDLKPPNPTRAACRVPPAKPLATHGRHSLWRRMAGRAFGDARLRKGEKLEPDNVLKKCYNIDKQYLLYVGSAYPHKNLVFLLKVFKKIDFDVQLVLAGRDSYFYQELKQKVREFNLEERVIFTGYVEDEKLDLLYKNAFCFVFPSLIEGFGFPPLEAMSRGVPVLSSNFSCLPEVLGDAVLYFDPENEDDLKEKILGVLNNENLRKDLIEKGFERIKRYDWEKCAEGYLEIIEGV